MNFLPQTPHRLRVVILLPLASVLWLSGCRAPNTITSDGGSTAQLPAPRNNVAPNNGAANRGNGAPKLQVYFSPRGDATAALIREINGARRQILVQAYSFTSAPIAEALVAAHRRGVAVRPVLDKSNATARYSGATFLLNAGIPVLIDRKHAIAHNKVMILDSATLVTGSFNFTKAAENSNAENLLIIKDDRAIIKQYEDNFAEHQAHSIPYERENRDSDSR
jgi:phosphatidylserine/phosphatidylglycerophosphate/cardiolipin synthase-like enzyme